MTVAFAIIALVIVELAMFTQAPDAFALITPPAITLIVVAFTPPFTQTLPVTETVELG